jgi:spore germination protein YaaH
MLASLRNVFLVLCLLLSACNHPIDPSEQRMLDYERLQTQSNTTFTLMSCEQFQQLWYDSQMEWQIEVPFHHNSNKSYIHIECIPSSIGPTLAQVTIRAMPRTRNQQFVMIHAWSLLLALTQMQGKSLIDASDDANRILDHLGVKPNGQWSQFLTKHGNIIRMPLGTQTLEIHKNQEQFVFSIISHRQSVSAEPVAAQVDKPRLNLSYLYFGTPSRYIEQIDRTNNTLNVISPNYFDVLDGGQLDITWKLDQTFIAEMKRRGIRVVPFLSNHWHRQRGIDALTAADSLTSQIVEAVERYDLDGVHIDIEGVGVAYRDAFTAFVRMMRDKMPAAKEVSVAVAANPNGWRTGWHGFYDYPALAEIADYLMIMSYDESWEGSEPGPVASFPFFERSLQYARNQGIPSSKIVMGIPFYGRLWQLEGAEQASIRGIGVSNSLVNSLITAYGGQLRYDEARQSASFMFTIPNGQGRYIAGKWCGSGQYILWFENDQSIKYKLRAIARSGIRGAGSWSLYQEATGTWDYFSLWLNGSIFRDVPQGFWAEEAIIQVAERGWMSGLTATDFAPANVLTRAEGAVILARAMGLEQVQSVESPFRDVSDSHWASGWIASAFQAGLINGSARTADGGRLFQPASPLSREQLSVLLARLIAQKSSIANDTKWAVQPFIDVPKDRWSYQAIMQLYQAGIVSGMTPTEFGVRRSATRAQMAVLMARINE